MTDTQRLFIASPVSGEIVDALETIFRQRDAISAKLPQRARWVMPEQWHLTWLFLGNVPTAKIPSIMERLSESLATVKPIPVEAQDIVFWPSAKKAKLIVCRLMPSPKLLRVFDVIRRALPDFPPDKTFTPHLTLARLKEPKEPVAAGKPGWSFDPLPPATCLLDTITLYSSTLNPTGAIYTPLHMVPLNGEP
jgi:2'-5' RNA ligase